MKDTCTRTGNPVYEPLMRRLRQQVRSGQVKPGELLGTEGEMAGSAGLSRKSVRRAVEELMREGLVERRPGKGVYVREPHAARAVIQIVVPSLEWDRCIKTVRGAKAEAHGTGAYVQIYDAHDNLDMDVEMITRLPTSGADGAIIVAMHHPRFTAALFELNRAGYPFVLVDQRANGIDVPCVLADNYAGGYRVGQELLRRGHRRIGYAGLLRPHTGRERMEGMRDAVLDAGVPFDRTLIADIEARESLSDWHERLARCTRELLSRPDRPTAVFFTSDTLAVTAYRTIKDLGLRVGEDVSVVGFDDDSVGTLVEPALSTVSQQAELLGRTAIQVLGRRMADPRAAPEHRVIETVWIARESVGMVKT